MTNEVPSAGIEPRTFRLLSECANHCAKPAGSSIRKNRQLKHQKETVKSSAFIENNAAVETFIPTAVHDILGALRELEPTIIT